MLVDKKDVASPEGAGGFGAAAWKRYKLRADVHRRRGLGHTREASRVFKAWQGRRERGTVIPPALRWGYHFTVDEGDRRRPPRPFMRNVRVLDESWRSKASRERTARTRCSAGCRRGKPWNARSSWICDAVRSGRADWGCSRWRTASRAGHAPTTAVQERLRWWARYGAHPALPDRASGRRMDDIRGCTASRRPWRMPRSADSIRNGQRCRRSLRQLGRLVRERGFG